MSTLKFINLWPTNKGDPQVRQWMLNHYSSPKGFVGRQLIYKIEVDGVSYGAIAGGSATRFLPGRNQFFPKIPLTNIVNNTFFHLERYNGTYPCSNFSIRIVKMWRALIMVDWANKYGDRVLGFETLVELPRLGTLYARDGWIEVGITKGYTCKRIAGKRTDSWTGRRVWETKNLRPKRVFCRGIE